ncbi:MAG: bactofilin family protein [Planctomycetota bacterium]|jgi:cytoskeletal protein CcmA (bactofilin family)
MAESKNEYGTIIGADAKFKGDLTFESAAMIEGAFEGSITAKGTVHVADGSVCKASVDAKEVAVAGHIEGNVQATDRVDLRPNGRITGDIVASRMSMADGASIVGHCRIGVSANDKATSTTEIKRSSAARATARTT